MTLCRLTTIASVINIALEMVSAPNLDEKWLFSTGEYKNFCRKERRQCHINSITAYLMSYNDKTGCLGNWHEGMLATNLMLWLQDLPGRLPQDPAQRLPKCRLATVWINELFTCLFRADLFRTEEECGYVVGRGMRMVANLLLHGTRCSLQESHGFFLFMGDYTCSTNKCCKFCKIVECTRLRSVLSSTRARWMRTLLERQVVCLEGVASGE